MFYDINYNTFKCNMLNKSEIVILNIEISENAKLQIS